MPHGLVIMEWNIRSGAELITKYPKNVLLDQRVMLRVYDIHEHASKEGITAFTDDNVNIISYYSGPKEKLYIILVLTILEDPDDYEKILEPVSQIIIKNAKDYQFMKLLPGLWEKIIEKS
ncbi:MAG: hypothetical protein ACTSXH_05775 [Promethearchaeota archaeon]